VRKAETPCAAAQASGKWSNFLLGREVGLDDGAGSAGGAGDHLRQAVVALRPSTMSTQGDRAVISAPSAWATQPATASTIRPPAASFARFCSRSRPSSENSFSAAFSRMWQVLRITMSAPSGVSAGA
jgi:hypothetical protein